MKLNLLVCFIVLISIVSSFAQRTSQQDLKSSEQDAPTKASRGIAHWSCSPTKLKKKEEENFLYFIFFCFLSLNLTVNFVVFHVLSSIFKYSVNSLELQALNWVCCIINFYNVFYTKLRAAVKCSVKWIEN